MKRRLVVVLVFHLFIISTNGEIILKNLRINIKGKNLIESLKRTAHPCDWYPCFRGVSCDKNGSNFICGPCPQGYIGDGIRCEAQIMGLCGNQLCYPGVSCVAKIDGYHCGLCPPGLIGDGINCKCTIGFVKNNFTCTDFNECSLQPCFAGVKCANYVPGFACGPCPRGFYGAKLEGVGMELALKKQMCRDIDECRFGNGGCPENIRCINTQGSFRCEGCRKGYASQCSEKKKEKHV